MAAYFWQFAMAALATAVVAGGVRLGIEIATAYVMRRLSCSRRSAALLVGSLVFVCGVPASLGYRVWSDVQWGLRGILETMDYAVSNVILPTGGILTALFVGWRWAKPALREVGLKRTATGTAWIWLLRVVVPGVIVVIFLRALES